MGAEICHHSLQGCVVCVWMVQNVLTDSIQGSRHDLNAELISRPFRDSLSPESMCGDNAPEKPYKCEV